MKIVENLFPELCNIYGESYSMTYLSRCNPEIDLRLTNHKTTPAFVTEDVDMIYLGCSPERKQEQIIQLLRPYTDRLRQLIDRGVIILATGNALEIFGREIREGDRVIPALGIFDSYAVRPQGFTRSCVRTRRRHCCCIRHCTISVWYKQRMYKRLVHFRH